MKKFGKIAGTGATLLVVFLYVICSLTPFIPPRVLPVVTPLSLGYLPMLVLYVITLVTWMFISRKKALLLFMVFFVGFKSFFATAGLNVFDAGWKQEKDSSCLRIMSWNVNRLGSPYLAADTPGAQRRQILALIAELKPDIICLQDLALNESGSSQIPFVNNIQAVREAGGFTAYTFPYYHEYAGVNYSDKIGVALFTRLPVKDSGSMLPGKMEKAGYLDVIFQSRPLRVYAAHLTSMSLWPNTKEEAGFQYLEGDSTQIKAKTIFAKLMAYGQMHASETEKLKAHMNKSPYPLILGADLNSVPSSYVYHRLKSGLKDAFLQKDIGIGGTYNRVFPKLRIDVLLHSKQLQVVQYYRPAVELSDHFPVIADIKWKE